MPTLRSIRWVFVMAPALLIVTGCGSNESNIDIKGTTTSPDAASSPEEMLKRAAAAPAKKNVPSGYPRPGR
jgi:hypothetical protein